MVKLTDQVRKTLAELAKIQLSAEEYSLLFYLLSRTNNFFEWLIVDRNQLATFLSLSITAVDNLLSDLQNKKVIKIKISHYETGQPTPRSFSVMLNDNFSEDIHAFDKNYTHSALEQEAVAIDEEKTNLISMVDVMKNLKYSLDIDTYANIVVEFFLDAKNLNANIKDKTFEQAKKLLESHSFDAVLFALKHFYKEIDSLETLDSKWNDYQGRLQKSLNQIDFEKAKQAHDQENNELREAAQKWMDDSEDKQLTVEEVRVLEIISEHEHPRRQLFWAYRFKENYPNLQNFFLENINRMLPVTTKGGVLKKKD